MNTKINDSIFNQFPILESERLILRAFVETDAKALFELRSNPLVMAFMDTLADQSESDSQKRIDAIQQSFQQKEGISWAIVEKASNQFIGYFGFWRFMKEHVRAEIGYALHPTFQGKGYMTEAAQTLLKYGFETISLHSMEANVNQNNLKSMQILEKLGFVKEAHFKENYFYNGEFLDSIIYSLLESNFPKKI